MTSKRILVSLACVAFLGVGAASAGLVDGVVAYWSFDSDFTADSGGSGFDMTAVNGATAGEAGGKFGGAAKFDRAQQEYAATTGDVLTQGGDHTYSVWIKCNTSNIPSGQRYVVLETAANDSIPAGSTDYGYTASLGIRDISGTDYVQVYTRDADGSSHTDITQGTGTTNWVNVIVTFDNDGGTGGKGLHSVYVNGSLATTMENTTPLYEVSSLGLARHRSSLSYNFDGMLDEVVFWNRVVTSEEITQLQTTTIPEPGTMVLLAVGFMGTFLRQKRV